MHPARGIAWTVLQHAGAVHNRANAGQARQPHGDVSRLGDVERDALLGPAHAMGAGRLANDRHHLVSGTPQSGKDRRAD